MKHLRRAFLVFSLALLLSLLLSGCFGYSEEYVEGLREEISRLEEQREDDITYYENRIDYILSEIALDIEAVTEQALDADEVIQAMQEENASFDAVNFADTTYRRVVDALFELYAKYVG